MARVLPAWLLALLLLAGCGFEPLHAPIGKGAVTPDESLAQIQIKPVEGRIGQQLHNLLLDRLNPSGQPLAPVQHAVDELVALLAVLAEQRRKPLHRRRLERNEAVRGERGLDAPERLAADQGGGGKVVPHPADRLGWRFPHGRRGAYWPVTTVGFAGPAPDAPQCRAIPGRMAGRRSPCVAFET